MSHTQRDPAAGGRAAASGYRHQYAVAASLTLDALRSPTFVEIRVEDPEAGRLDDVQIVREGRVDAYQVKWSAYSAARTLRALATSTNDAPSLLRQLADGWQSLRDAYPTRRVVVHLLTNDYPSVSDTVAEGDHVPTPAHTAAFLAQAWETAREGAKVDMAGPWAQAWQTVRDATGLDGDDLSAFVADCALDLQAPTPPDDPDLRAMADLIFEVAADRRRQVRVPRRQLLSRLGWTSRFEYRNHHEFEVPQAYRPIEATVSELQSKIASLPGGYVAVVGPPGSGKSTLLTRTLRERPGRVVRYYAFVREALDPTSLRGESTHFLHDVTLRLDEYGFGQGRRPDPDDRASLLRYFHVQLGALGEAAAENGTPSVILIDGLDHIEREQDPDRSLLNDLPLPNQIPAGVYVVLGSQRTDLEGLPRPIQQAVRGTDRRVEMARLTPADIESIATDAGLALDEDGLATLHRLSAGHPLALVYLVKRLLAASTDEERRAVLDAAAPYDDDIDRYYESHWERIEGDDELVHALALLARIRGSVDMGWASRWIGRPTARRLERVFGPYFDRDSVDRWTFFHNSFRLFLQAQTARAPFGAPPDAHERELHQELARLYLSADERAGWETLYHLALAGDHSEVVALATPEWFLTQARALRPLDAVQADLRLASRSAGETDDPLALVRLTLVAAALEQRGFFLSDYALPERLLDVGAARLAVEAARDGDRLRVGPIEALRLAPRFLVAGLAREASRLFELAEPYQALAGKPTGRHDHEARDTLVAWASAAPSFRDPSDVIFQICRTRAVTDHPDRSDDDATLDLHRWLLIESAVSAASVGDWKAWWSFLRALRQRAQGGAFELLLGSAEVAADDGASRQLLATLLRRYSPDRVAKHPRGLALCLRLAEGALDLGEPEVAEEWTAAFSPLPLRAASPSEGDGDDPLTERYRLYAVRYALGETRDPDAFVSADTAATGWNTYDGSDTRAMVRRLALAATTIASLWGRGRRGDRVSPSTFVGEVAWVLSAFGSYRFPGSTMVWELRASRPRVIALAVQAASTHGAEVVAALVDDLERRWAGDEGTPAVRRAVADELIGVGAPDLARRVLRFVDTDIEREPSPRERADGRWAQGAAWLRLGEVDAARAELERMVDGARGPLDDHDHQLGGWVRWLAQANVEDSDGAEARIRTMLRRIVAVHEEASGTNEAAAGLVAAAVAWSPRCAVELVRGFQELGVLDHSDAVGTFVRASLDVDPDLAAAALHILAALLVPFGGPGDDAVVTSLLQATAQSLGEDEALRAGRYLTERVRVWALATDRLAWFKAIRKGFVAIGADPAAGGLTAQEADDDNRGSTSASDPELALTDGRRLTLKEAIAEIVGAPDYLRLTEAADPSLTFYPWHDLALAAVDRVSTLDEIAPLADAVVATLDGRRAAGVLSRLSARARSLGDETQALGLARRALALSEPMGWDPWYDGGSRIEAVEALVSADPGLGRAVAVERFAVDLGTRFVGGHRIVHHLERIAPLLFDDMPVLETWTLVEDYLEDLFGSSPVARVPEVEDGWDRDPLPAAPDTQMRGLADLVALYLDHPSYVVAAWATQAATRGLVGDGDGVSAALIRAARESELVAERLLAIVEGASLLEPGTADPYRLWLQQVAVHSNLFLRARAGAILSRLDGAERGVPLVDRPLPALYGFILPSVSTHRTGEPDAAAVIHDPARLVRPMDRDLRAIAEAANLDPDAVLLRAARLAKSFAEEHAWLSSEATITSSRLDAFLDRGARLRVSYRKVHIAPVERAVGHVAGEIWDGRRLDARDAQALALEFLRDDPHLVRVDAVPRPSCVPPLGGIADPTDTWSVPAGWPDRADESLGLLAERSADGRHILAESSTFAFLGGDTRVVEDRFSLRGPRDPDMLDRRFDWGESPFRSIDALTVEAYAGGRTSDRSLVIQSRILRAETPGSSWIALDPGIGRDLGWTLSESGLFRWCDENGTTMVESVWWMDGLPERHDWRKRCEAAEGWLVLATDQAVQQIGKRVPINRQEVFVYRRSGLAEWKGARTGAS